MEMNAVDRTILEKAVVSPRKVAELRIKYHGTLADRISLSEDKRDILLLSQIVSTDQTLAEEIVRHESFTILKKKMLVLADSISNDDDDDSILLHELLCGILAFQTKIPRTSSCFTPDELNARLPLHFSFAENVNILMHQVTDRQSAQSDVGFGTS